jgi:AcrR family transcriptional regulator
MGRPPQYDEAAILEGARQVSAELGPQKLTIAAVAKRAGAPVGSIYHRYTSRDEILAALWLELVEEFQKRFLAELEGADVIRAGLSAVRYTCEWIGRHPRDARLLLLHRREDFAAQRWPASYRRRAQELTRGATARLTAYASRLMGPGASGLRTVRFILVDLPTAALRRDVEDGVPISNDVRDVLLHTCAYALRHAARSKPKSSHGR